MDDVRFDRVVRRIVQEVRNEGEQEKREAYKSLIINYAQGRTFAEFEEKKLLGYLERYSALHLQTLSLMENPKRRFPNSGGLLVSSTPTLLKSAFPKYSDEVLERVYSDLMEDGLVSKMIYGATMSGNGAYVTRTTPLGKKMLHIIEPATEAT